MITKIKAAEFHEVLKRDEQVVVKFGATWCGPCMVMTRQFEGLDETVYEIDVDQDFELVASLRIMTIPRLKVFKSGLLVREYTGVFSATADARFFVKNTTSNNV
jgi:thioredoxin 1